MSQILIGLILSFGKEKKYPQVVLLFSGRRKRLF